MQRSLHRKGKLSKLIESLESRQLLSGSTPYWGTPWGINQLIPAAYYDKGGAGVGYFDSSKTNLGNDTLRNPDTVGVSTGGSIGHVVTNTVAGEWLNFTLKVPTSGNYIFQASVANTATGAIFHPMFNGKNLTGNYPVPNTGSFSNFTTMSSDQFYLSANTYNLEIYVDVVASNGAGGNLNWFNLVPNPIPTPGTDKPFTSAFSTGANIPFVNYDKGGQGISFSDKLTANWGNSTFREPDAVGISQGGSSGNYVSYVSPGEWLNYTTKVATAGMYEIQVAEANPDAGAQYHLSLNGTDLSGELTTPTTTTNYTTFTSFTSTTPFALSAGTQTLQFDFDKAAANSAVGNFDYFKLVPYVPPTEAPYTTPFATSTVIPAANYDKGGPGIAYHVTDTTNLGNSTYRSPDIVSISTGGTTGNYVGYTTPTEWLRYSLNVATAGQYELEVNSANTVAGATIHASIGTTNLTGEMTLPATGGYKTFALSTSMPFLLSAGSQVLQVTFDTAASNGAVGNFDYFKLVPYSAPKDTPYSAPFTVSEVIPAANYDKGGLNVSYYVTNTSNLGNDNYRSPDLVSLKTGGTTGNLVAYTAAGEWLNYTVDIAKAGMYQLEASVANTAAGGSFHLGVNGTNVSGAIAITPTVNFTTFATDTSSAFQLAAGTYVVRISFDTTASDGALGNFDWFKLIPAT